MTTAMQREEALFEAARNLRGLAAQKAFLDQACMGDDALRARIGGLLEAAAPADGFFKEVRSFRNESMAGIALREEAQAKQAKVEALDAEFPTSGESSARIGHYKLLQKIGEGGCGVVYMAEQIEPVRRRVALKIIKLGMDTKGVIARFEAERQALAMMDHQNIARVFDAGATETGRPYFVMELVRGIRITDYCDQHHLDTRKRLDLFLQICQAIQHAHQKGIIHRDIKPSNVLVTKHDGVAVPKVIDFGIAKATEAQLTDKTLFTVYEQVIGTPAYMSPEQAELSGLNIDTRSDIYSLGVLLYELLTGRTPFDPRHLVQGGLDAMRHTLREQEPHRPSTMVTTLQGTELTKTAESRESEPAKLASLLRGDLDWIVMKALEKDRRRRYETANGLAMDIVRYLENEPVLARPPSRIYRFRKLVRRNKVIFGAGAAVALALLIGLGMSTWFLYQSRIALRRTVTAEHQAELARANESLLRHQSEAREKMSQGAFLVSQDRFEEADKLLRDTAAPAEPTIESAFVFRSLGEWGALQNQWTDASARFETLLKCDQLDGWDVATLDYLRLGAALVETSDQRKYRLFCGQTVEHFAGATNAVIAERAVKITLLTPQDEKILDGLAPFCAIAEKAFAGVDAGNPDAVFHAAWGSISLSLIEYRRGNIARAAEWCRRCLAYPQDNQPRTATAQTILAMCEFQLGQRDKAAATLAEGRALIENRFQNRLDHGDGEQGFWFDWIIARTILREASRLIGTGPANR